MPEVSIIVPVYKTEAYLPRCIDSILAQTFTDFELILVNDGSPDRCGAICDECAARDNRIRVIHKENGGVSSARNAALDVAVGTYIAFVDSDDTVSETYLEDLMQWRDYDYVTAGFAWQDRQNDWHVRVFEESDTTVDTIRALPSQYLGKYYFGSPWATLMKNAVIEEHSLRFDTSIHSGEDTLFIIAYLNHASSLKIAPICGYYYHYYAASLVNRLHDDYWRWKIIVEQAFLDFFSNSEDAQYSFLLERQFAVLKDLLATYDSHNSPEELGEIYMHPFFAACIAHKKKTGTFREKLLIRTMENSNYTLYKKVNKGITLVSRIKRKLQRLFWIGG